MASFPKLSTVISWFFYLIPIYIFIIAPALRQVFPDEADDLDDTETPSLHLSDDSFISHEDGTPLNCPGGNDYRVHILAVEPLVIYVEDFLKDWEADHLVNVRCDTAPNLHPAKLYQLIATAQRNKLHPLNSLRRRDAKGRPEQTAL